MTRCFAAFVLVLAGVPADAQVGARYIARLTGYQVRVESFCASSQRQESTITVPGPAAAVTTNRVCGASTVKIDAEMAAPAVTGPMELKRNSFGSFELVHDTPIRTVSKATFTLTTADRPPTNRGGVVILSFPTADGPPSVNPVGRGTCESKVESLPAFEGTITPVRTVDCQRSPVWGYNPDPAVPGGVRTNSPIWSFFSAAISDSRAPHVSVEILPVYSYTSASADILITHLHAVQAVQTPKEHVTLIGGKRTIARVFIKTLGQGPPAQNVTAILRCQDRDGKRYSAVSTSPPITAPLIAAPPEPGTPPNLADPSADIVIPEPCTQAQTSLSMEAEALLPGGLQDTNPANNKLAKNFAFVTPPGSRPFRIGYVGIRYRRPTDNKLIRPPAAAIATADSRIRQMFPVPEGRGLRYFPLSLSYPAWTGDLSKGLGDLLSDFSMFTFMNSPPEAEEFDQVVGWLGYDPAYTAGGVADAKWVGGEGTASLAVEAGPEFNKYVLAHEVAHNIGLRHTNVADPEGGCPVVAPDPETAWPHADARIHTHGYSPARMRTLSPNLHDFMSYCPPKGTWVSPYTAEVLYANELQPTGGPARRIVMAGEGAQKQSESGPRLAEVSDKWLISVRLRSDGSLVMLDPVLLLRTRRASTTGDANGSHCLTFAGSTTGPFCFNPVFRNSEGITVPEKTFVFLVPVVADATRLALTRSGQELGAIARTGGLTVAFTSPQGGARWDGGIRTLTWQTNGGGGTRFGVQYSLDGGQSWMALAANLREAALEVDTSELQGGDNLRFRVLAGRGLDTAVGEVGPVTLLQTPRLELAGERFDLRNAVVNQPAEKSLLIGNSGTGPLTIRSLTTSDPQFQVLNPAPPAKIAAATEIELVLRFVPTAPGRVSGTLRIESDDPARSVVLVPLDGNGIESPAPDAEVAPRPVDFGRVIAGQTRDRPITIRNHGPLPLNVAEVRVPAPFAHVGTAPQAFALESGEERALMVRFAPSAAGVQAGNLTLISDDPSKPSLETPLRGEGVAAGSVPVPTINSGGVVNAASFTSVLAPGALASIFGVNLAASSRQTGAVPWPRILEGVQVLMDGVAAPVYFVSPGQVNFQVPFEVEGGNALIRVVRDGIEGPVQQVAVADYAPGVFTYARTSTAIDPIVIHADGSLVTPDRPARPGEVVIVFVTGIGSLTATPASGARTPASPLPAALTRALVTLGTTELVVHYAGLTPTFIGLGQINIQIPAVLPAGAASLPLVIRFGTAQSAPVQLAVRP